MQFQSLFVMLCLTFAASVCLGDALANKSPVSAPASTAPSQAPAKSSAPAPAAPSINAGQPVVEPGDGGIQEIGLPVAISSSDDLVAPSALAASMPSTASAPASDVAHAVTDAAHATQIALQQRNLPAWLAAFASILWMLIAFARRNGKLISRKAVAITTLVAAVVGATASQMLLGFSSIDALVFAFGGPGAIALNEVARAFGFGKPANNEA